MMTNHLRLPLTFQGIQANTARHHAPAVIESEEKTSAFAKKE
jgi:hypothetical protein